MQTKQDLEEWYSKPDQWGYFNNPEDERRLKNILNVAGWGKRVYRKAIDIGCGEGFITRHIPAEQIHGYDFAQNALNRLPPNVIPVTQPEGKYDLVLCTGVLYQQYDHEAIYNLIMQSAEKYIVIGGIESWLIQKNFGKQLYSMTFSYREFTQKVTLYEVGA